MNGVAAVTAPLGADICSISAAKLLGPGMYCMHAAKAHQRAHEKLLQERGAHRTQGCWKPRHGTHCLLIADLNTAGVVEVLW
jgi:hypothetical protein